MIQPRSSASPHTAMTVVILNHLGGSCELAVLPQLLGISGMELAKCLQELERLGLLEEASGSVVSLAPRDRQPRNILERALLASALFNDGTVASALYSFYKRDLRRFLEQAAAAIKILIEKDRPLAIRRAYDALVFSILKMHVPLRDKDFCFYFIEKCMNIQREIIKFPSNSRKQILLYHKIKGIAFYIGDKRSIGYINICMGSMNQNIRSISKSKSYHRNMQNGKDIILSLGDRDIIMMSSQFIVLYYLLEANFNEGMNFAYSVLFSGDEDANIYLSTAFYNYTSICAASTGNYDLANTILKSGMQRINKLNKGLNIDSIKAFLAYICILQNQDEEALQIIDELLGMHGWSIMTYADLWASRALAYYHYKRGDLPKSYTCFKNLLQDNSYRGISHSNYLVAPFVLELLGAYYTAGYHSPQELTIHEELHFSMASPSRLVRAVALCVAGQVHAHDHGWHHPQVRTYLEKSLQMFRTFSAPPDMAKTLLAVARMHQATGEMEQARAAAAEAWEICRHYGQPHWPGDLDNLLTPATKVASTGQSSPFDLTIELLHNIRSQSTFNFSNNLLNSLLGSLLVTFGIGRGCVFHGDGTSLAPELSVNMDDIADDLSPGGSWENLIQKAFQDKRSLVINKLSYPGAEDTTKPADAAFLNKKNLSIFIFVDALNYGTYIFCLSGMMLVHIACLITDELVRFIENCLSTQICINIAQNAAWQDRLKSTKIKIDYSQDDLDFFFESQSMKEVIDRVDNLARKDTTVLILGESGVGKELIAKRFHAKSLRKGEFVSVNLANIPYELFESECYGHEKGSFTGANYQKRGLFELADSGTLFIDEIGDIPLALQVKLLRVLQEKQFMRVGGTKILHSNFRLITATNRNLESEIKRGRFREDLYYRLNVVSIRIPPLRERKDDVICLVDYFLQYYCLRYQLPLKHLSADTKQKIMNYPWPGNVRELKNYVERYCVLSDNDIFPPPVQTEAPQATAHSSSTEAVPVPFNKKPSLQDLNDKYFEYIYTLTNGSVGGVNGIASILGISRTTAYAWIERLGLKEKYRLVLKRFEA